MAALFLLIFRRHAIHGKSFSEDMRNGFRIMQGLILRGDVNRSSLRTVKHSQPKDAVELQQCGVDIYDEHSSHTKESLCASHFVLSVLAHEHAQITPTSDENILPSMLVFTDHHHPWNAMATGILVAYATSVPMFRRVRLTIHGVRAQCFVAYGRSFSGIPHGHDVAYRRNPTIRSGAQV